jgi:hypothetical protein
MLKNLNNKYFKIFLISFILLYFYITLDLNYLFKEFKSFNKNYFFLGIILFFPNTFLVIYKWFLLTKKFSNDNFIFLYKKFTYTFFLADLIHNPALIEISKFISLKKISSLEKTAIIINDKIIIILTKIIYSFFFLFLIYQTQIIEFFLYNFKEKKIYFYLIIFSTFFVIIVFKFKKYILRYYTKYLSSKIIERRKIFLIEILKNILMSCLYFISFLQFTSFENALLFSALSPLIETLIRLQLITTFGFREIIIFIFGNYLGINQKIILSSLFITFVTYSISALNLLLSLCISNKVKKKIKSSR